MYLISSKRSSAQQARVHCIAARSLVSPDDGFWQVLCALEGCRIVPCTYVQRSEERAHVCTHMPSLLMPCMWGRDQDGGTPSDDVVAYVVGSRV